LFSKPGIITGSDWLFISLGGTKNCGNLTTFELELHHISSGLSLGVLFTYTVCFVQLRNRLNMQREQLLKAQQNSQLGCHQQKDSVVQNSAELQHAGGAWLLWPPCPELVNS